MLYQTPTRKTSNIPTLYTKTFTVANIIDDTTTENVFYSDLQTGITNLYSVIDYNNPN